MSEPIPPADDRATAQDGRPAEAVTDRDGIPMGDGPKTGPVHGADPLAAGTDRGDGAPRDGAPRDGASRDGAAADGSADPARAVATGDAHETDDAHAAGVRRWREQSRRRKEKPKRPWWIELPILIVIAFVLTFLIQTFIARVYYVPSGSMEQTLHGTSNGGDRILAFKLVYDFRAPEQGEVVVFKGPDTWAPEADIPGPTSWFGKAAQALGSVVGIAPPNEKDFVKRVIAVGGQKVSCCDRQGRVQVDGVPLDEPYIYQPIDAELWGERGFHCQVQANDPTHYNSRRCFGSFTVPKGELWVMGDHRSDSSDSSYNCLGLTEDGMAQYRQLRQTDCGRPIPVDDVIGKAVFIVMPPSRWGTIGSPDIMSSAAPATVTLHPQVGPAAPLPAMAPPLLGVLGAVGLRRLRRRPGRRLTARWRFAHGGLGRRRGPRRVAGRRGRGGGGPP